MNWWSNASTSQRLTQIDAAIAIGLTAEQARIICHCGNRATFLGFCARHKRRFRRDTDAMRAKLAEIGTKRFRRSHGLPEEYDDEDVTPDVFEAMFAKVA